jgi:hypothetical protein
MQGKKTSKCRHMRVMSAKSVRDGARNGSGRVSELIFSGCPIGVDDIYKDQRIEVVPYGCSNEIRIVGRSSVPFAESCELGLQTRDRKGKLKQVVFGYHGDRSSCAMNK